MLINNVMSLPLQSRQMGRRLDIPTRLGRRVCRALSLPADGGADEGEVKEELLAELLVRLGER
jgi:hypothetical protein